VPHRIFERERKPGGLAVTVEEAGYRFDRTGHLLHLRDPALRSDILGWLGPESVLEIDRKSVVLSHGVTTKYPFQANVYGLPRDVAYACVRDFVAARFDASPRPVRTFEDFCLRHFGEAISAAFMVPYNEKLWGVHPREITAAWCDRFVPVPSVEDVLRGAFGVDPPSIGYNTRFLYPRLGIGELSRALAERASTIELGQAPSRIDWRARMVDVGAERVAYRRLVSTLPLDVLVKLLDDCPAEVLAAGARLRATHLYYFDLALNTPCEVDWHWAYVPAPEVPFYRVGAYSNLSPAMAPTGKACLYVELSGRDPAALPALAAVAGHLVDLGVIRAPEAIRFGRLRRIDHAYVVFDDAHEASVSTIRAFLAEAGIESVGRYGSWTYSSMEDAIVAGRAAAEQAST
jgi:protoporphyrinogen oxidase